MSRLGEYKYKPQPGDVFGSWTVISEMPRELNKMRKIAVRCSCGNEAVTLLYSLLRGESKSCIPCGAKRAGYKRTQHGDSSNRTRAYRAWLSMRERVFNPNHHAYASYGGRGIEICQPWSESFPTFLSDMGEPPPGLSLDRRDNDRGYNKDNCRWATRKQQSRNIRSNRNITIGGETRCLAAWLDLIGISQQSFYQRVKRGMTVERALTLKPKRPSASA